MRYEVIEVTGATERLVFISANPVEARKFVEDNKDMRLKIVAKRDNHVISYED